MPFYVSTNKEAEIARQNAEPYFGSISATFMVTPSGAPVRNAQGNAMVAPTGFDPILLAQKLGPFDWSRTMSEMFFDGRIDLGNYTQFGRNGWADLQRSYNGLVAQGGDGFVDAFRPVASWAVGYSAAFNNIPSYFALAAGGYTNLLARLENNNIVVSANPLNLFNNPENSDNIKKVIMIFLN